MTKTTAAIVGALIGLILPIQLAFADGGVAAGPLSELTGEWWQWALSIPNDQNPQIGRVRAILHGRPARRVVVPRRGLRRRDGEARLLRPRGQAAVLSHYKLFLTINTPDCGQKGENFGVKKLISLITSSIDAAQNLSVTVDGKPLNRKHIQRVLSLPFPTWFPGDNIYGPDACGPGKPLPAGIYSPSMDDGYYVLLPPLKVGPHTLQFHAESGTFLQDVTYNLTVAPVSLK